LFLIQFIPRYYSGIKPARLPLLSFREVSQVYEQMENPDRRILLEFLRDAEQTVANIAEKIGPMGQTVSKNLGIQGN